VRIIKKDESFGIWIEAVMNWDSPGEQRIYIYIYKRKGKAIPVTCRGGP
jgi:hypothetical protein